MESHVCDKALCRQKEALIEQAKKVAKPPQHSTESYEIHLYNAKVVGAQSYYKIATHINIDFNVLNLSCHEGSSPIDLERKNCNRLRRKGRPLTKAEIGLYGNTPMMRYVAGSDEPNLSNRILFSINRRGRRNEKQISTQQKVVKKSTTISE